jgi:ABC-type multidrug transport system ATPase subunit
LVTLPEVSPTGIRFDNIEKRYGGLYALRRVSFEVGPGECVVLAGRNGSGKTTLLRIAARLVKPSAGQLSFPGATSDGGFVARNTGFVAHAIMAYDELTAEENLVLFARLLGVAQAAKRVEELLQEVGLFERRDSLVRTFSRGMRQRVAIARALLHAPSVLLLDEPATGLDSQGASWLTETLRRMRDARCTILMSLHGETELSALASRAIRLDSGAVVADTRTGASFRSILTFADA